MSHMLSPSHRPVLRFLNVPIIPGLEFAAKHFHSITGIPTVVGNTGIATIYIRENKYFHMADLVDSWKREKDLGALSLHFEEPLTGLTVFHKIKYAPFTDPLYFKILAALESSYSWHSDDSLFLLSVQLHLMRVNYRED